MGTQAFREADVLGPGRGKLEAVWLFGGKAKSYTFSNIPLCSIGWMCAKTKRLSVGVERRHPVTMRKRH